MLCSPTTRELHGGDGAAALRLVFRIFGPSEKEDRKAFRAGTSCLVRLLPGRRAVTSAAVAKMAQKRTGLEVVLDADRAVERGTGALRRCRGRPRLTDSDRAQRRLESRKKYDVRRVYLGEAHKLWSELRRRTSLSDAGLAEYLMLLNSTCGEKYMQKFCGKKNSTEISVKQKKCRKEQISSLQSLVRWYQEHAHSCPQEPQLTALEPQPNLSTVAIWRCDSDHSFVQYLFSPLRGASDSEHEADVTEGDGENAVKTDMSVAKSAANRKRRKEAHKLFNNVEDNPEVSEAQRTTVSPVDQTVVLNHRPGREASSRDAPVTEQSVWEMKDDVVVQQQDSPAAAFHSIPSEEEVEEAEDLRRGRDGGAGGVRTLPHRYGCVAVKTSLPDKPEKMDKDSDQSQNLSDSVPAEPEPELSDPLPMQEQSELFDPQTLQTMVTSCEIPDQRIPLEGSQLIIITGPSYEALASEGIQLNMGGGNVEEVTCTVIGGVSYNQVCTSDSKLRPAEDEDSITALSEKQLLQPTDDALDLSSDRQVQRSSIRSKRNRRGPVIEADGMLKMFHCPYEGCSQVYVAISSFQNHVNLVHRKGKTKVCPHPGCGKKFYLSNHLHRHMIIHSGVRDFICETCGKSFKRKNHLEVHRRTHTGETPLQCEICGYQCRQRASLNWHMKKHTPEAHYNYTCEFCEKRFEKLDSVKFHKLKSHPDKQPS
ncbi:zinc finger protein 653 isoform X2 [Antennarius striatus]|uniref:zinc finger protein 653 isoform X2 n=1 Tax=Antennarius striatus TaxID=241820 RepID=UPI0035B2E22D